jgi:hypothetical protein
VDSNRYLHINRRPEDVRREDIEELARQTQEAQPATKERLDRDVVYLNDSVRRIRQRGGLVVFTVLPVSGLRRTAEERSFPRADFWGSFVARIDTPTIHFSDYPELSGFPSYDGSHLSVREAPTFTRSFVSVLKTKLASASARSLSARPSSP